MIKLYKVIDRIRSKWLLWFSASRIEVGKNLVIKSKPIIDVAVGCKLIIGANVTLNSRNKGYHVGMYSPVKLFADRPGAIISIGNNTRIHGSCIHAYKLIEIGDNCLIAANCQIFDGSGHYLSLNQPENRINTIGESKAVKLCDNVWLGSNCIILPGIEIGEGSVVAAGSVVTRSVPPYSVVGGNPAKIIKS